jgi:hypothetical protein
MLKGVPFVAEMAGAIRVAWDPEKASGPHRRLLLSFCQALAPYLRGYPAILSLFDDIPEFASDFGKAVLDCGALRLFGGWRACGGCGFSISMEDSDLRISKVIFHTAGTSIALHRPYCSMGCYEDFCSSLKHDLCQICSREEKEEEEAV